MSESTNDSSASDILSHLPPEVAAALGKLPKDSTPDPTDASEEESTDELEKTEAVDPEQSADGEEEDAADEEQNDDSTKEESPKALEKLEKRIDKLTQRRKEAEAIAEDLKAENTRLKGEVESRSAIRLEPSPEDPLADIESAHDLESKVSAAKKVRAWALANPDGATVTNPDGTERYVERAEIARFVAQTDALLTDHAPTRREYLRERESLLPEAKSTYPDLFKPGTAQHEVLIDTLRRVPLLKKLPGYELVIGDAIAGMQLRMERATAKSKALAANGKSAPTVTERSRIAPAIPRATPSRPPNSTGKEKSRNLDRVIAGGGIDALANYFASA